MQQDRTLPADGVVAGDPAADSRCRSGIDPPADRHDRRVDPAGAVPHAGPHAPFEKRAYDLFLQSLVKGTSHLSLGMEAIAAGFGVAMRADDWTFATYRGHAHTLARGSDMAATLGELLGRANGLLKRQGRLDAPHRASSTACSGRTPSSAPTCRIALGAAWSSQYREQRPGRGVLLRRRCDEHRRVPRGAEPGGHVASCPSSSCARTTSTWSTPRSARSPPSSARPPTGLGAYGLEPIVDRRQRRRGGVPDRARGARAGAARRRAVARRGADLPARRPLACRPRHVPPAARGRSLAAAGPDTGVSRRACSPTAWTRRRWTRSTPMPRHEVDAATEAAKAAPPAGPRRADGRRVGRRRCTAWRN